MTAFSDFTKKVYLKNVIINNQLKLIVFTVAKKHWEDRYIVHFKVLSPHYIRTGVFKKPFQSNNNNNTL